MISIQFGAIYRYERYEDAVKLIRKRKQQGIPVRKISDAFLDMPHEASETLALKQAGTRPSSVRSGGYIFTASHMKLASDLIDKIEFLRGVTRVREASDDSHWKAERKKFADVWRLWDFEQANPSLSEDGQAQLWQFTADLAKTEAEKALQALRALIKSTRAQKVEF